MSAKPVSQALRRRSSRSVPAAATAVVLLAAATAVAWAGIFRLATGSWPAFLGPALDYLSTLVWNSPPVWTAAVLLGLIGLVLILAAVLPGKHTTARLAAPDATDERDSETAISRRGLARIARAHVDQTDGVDSSSVRATAKKVDVIVHTPLHDAGDLAGRLQDSLGRKLGRIGVNPLPKVVVRVRTSND